MANNGYLLSDGSCTTSIQSAGSEKCPTPPNLNYPLMKSIYIFVDPGGSGGIQCFGVCLSGSGWCGYASAATPVFSCDTQPKSTIPTVSDGITLGWQAGGALILVAAVLFLKKAFT